MIEQKFKKNIGTFSEEDLEKLSHAKVFVAGCGGSGYLIDQLVRLGIGTIAVVDGDCFEETNINRQAFANMKTIGRKKVEVAKEYAEAINPAINFIGHKCYLTEQNAKRLIKGYDIVLDCVDDRKSKLVIQKICNELEVPLIFGGMSMWFGQVGVSLPGDSIVDKVYGVENTRRVVNVDKKLLPSTTSFVNAFTSSLYVALCAKIVTKKYCENSKLYIYDLLGMKIAYYDVVEQKISNLIEW